VAPWRRAVFLKFIANEQAEQLSEAHYDQLDIRGKAGTYVGFAVLTAVLTDVASSDIEPLTLGREISRAINQLAFTTCYTPLSSSACFSSLKNQVTIFSETSLTCEIRSLTSKNIKM
jgi:hypothetical protein